MTDNLVAVEKILGYTYKKKELLLRALTHNSGIGKGSRLNYQNLEFLGDSILNFVIAEELLTRHPNFNEGQLTRLRAAIVSEKPLSETILGLGLNKYLIMGYSETKMRINYNASVMEDMFEAITASIYLDGGIRAAKSFILRSLSSVIKKSETDQNGYYDYKSILNEYANKHTLTVKYVGVEAENNKSLTFEFVFDLLIDGEVISRGVGSSKKEAQQMAAKLALKKLDA